MSLLLAALGCLLVGAALALLCGRHARLAAICGAGSAALGCALGEAYAIGELAAGSTTTVRFAWAVPNGALSMGVDPLSAFFLVPLFAVGGLSAVYGRSYLLELAKGRSLAVPFAGFNLLIASMAVLIVARHALVFLVAWEVMSLTAYVLITFEHEHAAVRRAGWVYLIATHVGTACLIVFFSLLGRYTGSFELNPLAAGPNIEQGTLTAAQGVGPSSSLPLFGLALLGFAAKAGLVPLHVWLPEAHAAAPSHVSALMSAVLIKMGLYGVLRTIVLLGGPTPWLGPSLMLVGLGGAGLGVVLACQQRDLKRALAYSSIENVGLCTLGIGLGLWGASSGRPLLASCGLAAGLLHIWNHAAMKGLTFLAAGSVAHACHERDLEQLGGLYRRMPVTSVAFVLGATALSGLPPLCGFVGEWLLYSGLLHGTVTGTGAQAVLMAMAATGVCLVGALSVLCFIRLIGVALLGSPRGAGAARAHESPLGMWLPMAGLALLLLGLALGPGLLAGPLERLVAELLPARPGVGAHRPLAELGLARIGQMNAALLAVLGSCVLLATWGATARGRASDASWGCGYLAPSSRMQYGARASSELLTSGLLPQWLAPNLVQQLPVGPFPGPSRLQSEQHDPLTRRAYEPFFTSWAERFVKLRWMQQGLLHIYIVYILVALLLALAYASSELTWARP